MTRKFMKIILLLLIFSFFTTYVLATDIDLNLPTSNDNLTTAQNSLDAENNTSVDNGENLEDQINNNTELQDDFTETLQPTTFSKAETGLTTSNIINILLITVGVILILLAIAIIIRLKN